MSDSEDDFDIAGNIALHTGSDSEDFSDSGSDSEQEFQDEIISSDEDEQEQVKQAQPKKKKQKTDTKNTTANAFPSLELSDDEEDLKRKKDDVDFADYFTIQPQNKAKGGTFASFGFSKFLLNNISKKGFKQPTPIQRKTIPLIMQNRDIVGMARTGSGKTAAFSLPLIEKLKMHSAKVGVRAIILSPSRELALQTHKVIKDFTKGNDLRSVLLVGGDSLEEQFNMMMTNPDIVVATPGRFLHLKLEMKMDLKALEFMVFDEADRLFEMGFQEQLTELIAALPSNRQSLLFSATLPSTLVDFAKAGLTNPVLVRLDTETKISERLEMAFLSTKQNEREATLLNVIQDVIRIPQASVDDLKKLEIANRFDSDSEESDKDDKKKQYTKKKKNLKRKRLPPANVLPSPYSTIVFVPTRHHVEYITLLLKDAGYAVSYIYGTLDQHARRQQLMNFRTGLAPLMVVTDVAARGIDIPVLANVINFSLPASSKIFIHRVGRTARAGNRGWAYSIVSEMELPYLLDLELFLGRKIMLTPMHEKKCEILKAQQGESYVEPKVNYSDRMILGSGPRLNIENMMELFNNLITANYDLSVLQGVALKAEKLYFKTRQAAGGESVKRAKEIKAAGWDEQNLIFGVNLEKEKLAFLEKLKHRYNKETVFEFGKKDDSLVDLMNTRRRQIAPIQRRAKELKELREKEREAGLFHNLADEVLKSGENEVGYRISDKALDAQFETAEEAIAAGKQNQKKKTFRDPNFFISHYAPAAAVADQQLAISNGFVNDANNATFDLSNDDKVQNHKQTAVMQWDKKKHKYVNSKSTDKKYIIGESGVKIPATYRAGVYDAWKNNHKTTGYKTGARESAGDYRARSSGGPGGRGGPGGPGGPGGDKKYLHNKQQAPRAPDKFRDDFHKQKKKVEKAMEGGMRVKGYNKPGQKSEMKSTDDIRKSREQKDQRRQKNARPSKKKKY